jgi:hypothetical protein
MRNRLRTLTRKASRIRSAIARLIVYSLECAPISLVGDSLGGTQEQIVCLPQCERTYANPDRRSAEDR